MNPVHSEDSGEKNDSINDFLGSYNSLTFNALIVRI